MKQHLILFILALSLLLCGCTPGTSPAPPAESISVYRELAEGFHATGLLRAELLPLDSDEDPFDAVLAALSGAAKDPALKNPLPSEVELLAAEPSGSLVRVSISRSYLDLPELQKTLIKACLTLSLCALDGVDFISIGVGGETLDARLTTEDFLLFDSVISAERVQARIYYPKAAARSLGAEYRSIGIGGENSVEREILDAILRGPSQPGLRRAFPEGTVASSVYTIDGICSVSLSGLKPEPAQMTPENAELAVYSIVNSLTALSNVKSVHILIEGEVAQELWGFHIAAPLSRNEGLIGSSPPERG